MAQNEKNICDSTYEQLCELIIDIKTQAEYNKYDGNIDNYDELYWYFTGKARASDAVKGINDRNKKIKHT